MLQKLAYGGMVAVIGMFIVFLGLVILILCVTIMGKIFQALTKPKAPKAVAAPAPAPVSAPTPVATPVAQEASAPETDPQLIAAIAAAIAAFDGSNKTLVVHSVRRVSGWNGAARREQVYRF